MFGKALRHPKSPRPRRARLRPAVEQLEGRTVPAFMVSNLNDAGQGSLRQAILDANAAADADVISFQPGLSGTIPLTSGHMNITASVTITGPGAGALTVSGSNISRIFNIDNVAAGAINVTISGLTLTLGNVPTSSLVSGGGAILEADENLVLSGVVITGNTAKGGGGGMAVLGGRLTLEGSTISNNTVTPAPLFATGGGGLFLSANSVATIRNSTVSGNQANEGGGITLNGGTLMVENSTLSNNHADASKGGAIAGLAGAVVVRNCTISGNTAERGGGIFVQKGLLTLENSTISGNSSSYSGGGIAVNEGAGITPVTLANSTIAFNMADSDNTGGGDGGGVHVFFQAEPMTLRSTIVAKNAVGSSGTAPDISGSAIATNCLIKNTTGTTFAPGSAANLTGMDPLLRPLANNGGPTQTHALRVGITLFDTSPAINKGSNPEGLTTDQRGAPFVRVFGDAADIGAFEVQPPPAPPPPPPPLPPLSAPPQITAVAFRRNGVARVRVKDAASGAVRKVLTPFKGFGGRLRLQLFDVNGDGSRDLIVKALIRGKRKHKVFDAVTLALLP